MATTIEEQKLFMIDNMKAEVIRFISNGGTTITLPLKFVRDIKAFSYATDSSGGEKFHITTTANTDSKSVVMTTADTSRKGCVVVVGF